MDSTIVIVIAVASVAVLAAIAFLSLARRSDVRGAGALSSETVRRDSSASAGSSSKKETTAAAEAAGVEARTPSTAVATTSPADIAPWVPPDPEAIGVSRRQFFNRATIGLMSAGLGAFAAASFVAFLWPTKTGGFGGKVPVGRVNDVFAGIRAGSGFFYAPEARAWITEYPKDSLPKAIEVYQPALIPNMTAGITVQYQKCPHLGCRVPQCVSSQWFECGCHGSTYNRVGEKKGGPAPRGMDHFAAEITTAGDVIVDTGTVYQGQPIGTNTTGQEAEGPNCVGASEH